MYLWAKTTYFYSKFSRGEPPEPDTLNNVLAHCCNSKKKCITNQSHNNKRLISPLKLSSLPFFLLPLFCLLNFKVEGSEPPWANVLDPHLINILRLQAKTEVPRDVRNSKVRKQDIVKFRRHLILSVPRLLNAFHWSRGVGYYSYTEYYVGRKLTNILIHTKCLWFTNPRTFGQE